MLNPERVLVPVDFSPCSTQALRYALSLANPERTEVHVLHADVLHEHEHAAKTRRRLDQLADAERDRLSGPVPAVKTSMTSELTATPAILSYADRHGVDLIVMGTHGRHGFRRWMLGSVAREVIQQAPCEVLTIRQSLDDVPRLRAGSTILVPVDFSGHAAAALAAAREIAAACDARLDLIHVIEDRIHPAFYGPAVQSIYDLEPDIEEKAVDHMRRMFEDTGGPAVPAGFLAFPGHAARGIVRYAEEHNAALIAMSTHGRTGLEHVLLGSVTERVVERAPCPVLAVPALSADAAGDEHPAGQPRPETEPPASS